MTDEELKTIFVKLRDQTIRKQVKWKPHKNDLLRLDFPRSSILLAKNSTGFPILYILNSGGSQVAEVNQYSFNTGTTTGPQLKDMWKRAYEIAFETDETVQDILSKLGGP